MDSEKKDSFTTVIRKLNTAAEITTSVIKGEIAPKEITEDLTENLTNNVPVTGGLKPGEPIVEMSTLATMMQNVLSMFDEGQTSSGESRDAMLERVFNKMCSFVAQNQRLAFIGSINIGLFLYHADKNKVWESEFGRHFGITNFKSFISQTGITSYSWAKYIKRSAENMVTLINTGNNDVYQAFDKYVQDTSHRRLAQLGKHIDEWEKTIEPLPQKCSSVAEAKEKGVYKPVASKKLAEIIHRYKTLTDEQLRAENKNVSTTRVAGEIIAVSSSSITIDMSNNPSMDHLEWPIGTKVYLSLGDFKKISLPAWDDKGARSIKISAELPKHVIKTDIDEQECSEIGDKVVNLYIESNLDPTYLGNKKGQEDVARFVKYVELTYGIKMEIEAHPDHSTAAQRAKLYRPSRSQVDQVVMLVLPYNQNKLEYDKDNNAITFNT